MKRARETLDIVRGELRRFRVRYAWLVTIETDMLPASEEDIARMPLPGVYEGVPSDHVPNHVQNVTDCDAVWEIGEL
jgi:hypothetical protein